MPYLIQIFTKDPIRMPLIKGVATPSNPMDSRFAVIKDEHFAQFMDNQGDYGRAWRPQKDGRYIDRSLVASTIITPLYADMSPELLPYFFGQTGTEVEPHFFISKQDQIDKRFIVFEEVSYEAFKEWLPCPDYQDYKMAPHVLATSEEYVYERINYDGEFFQPQQAC